MYEENCDIYYTLYLRAVKAHVEISALIYIGDYRHCKISMIRDTSTLITDYQIKDWTNI